MDTLPTFSGPVDLAEFAPAARMLAGLVRGEYLYFTGRIRLGNIQTGSGLGRPYRTQSVEAEFICRPDRPRARRYTSWYYVGSWTLPTDR